MFSRPQFLMRSVALVASVLTIVAPSVAEAQVPEQAVPPASAAAAALQAAQAAALRRAVLPTSTAARSGAATLDSSVSLPQAFEISADEDSSEITYKASFKLSGDPTDPGAMQYFSLIAKAPLNEGNGEGLLGSLKGLGNATSVELKFTAARVKGTYHPTARDGPAIQRICRETEEGYIEKTGEASAPLTLISCSPPRRLVDKEVKTYAPEEFENYKSLFFDREASMTLWGVSAAAGDEKFDYKDPSTFADMTVHKTPWSVGAYYAYQKLRWQGLITARFDHKTVYEPAKKETRCSDPTDTSTCLEAVFGVPTKKEQDIASIEVRRKMGQYAVALTASYDVGEDEVAFDLPIYLVRGSDGAFNGGVRATWNSKERETKIGVFMNQRLCLLSCDL